MQSPFSRIKKIKDRKQAEVFVNKGLRQLEGNFYNNALLEFQKALELDQEVVSERLSYRFTENLRIGDNDKALSIGLILIKIKDNDHVFVNQLGNCARKLQKFKQANNLYKQALRINRKYDLPLYNLAASMGRIDKYDLDVKNLIGQFDKISDFVLPDYVNNSKILEQITEELIDEKKEEMEGDVLYEPTYNEISSKFKSIIGKNSKEASTGKDKSVLAEHIFNLGLYALENRDSNLAIKCFLRLKKQKSRMEYLDMVITLAMSLEDPSKKVLDHLMKLLSKDRFNRYLNVNLALMYKRNRNRLLSYKYFALGALLLEKTNGVYGLSDLIKRGDDEYELGNLNQALKHYKIVESETENSHVQEQIGQILLMQNNYSEALPMFRKILKTDPQSAVGLDKINEIHNYYCERAEELFDVRKFSPAASLYEKALDIERRPETIQKAIGVYNQLMNYEKANMLAEELKEQKRKQREDKEQQIVEQSIEENEEQIAETGEQTLDEKEKLRLKYIRTGKEYLIRKDFGKAVDYFEKAFPLKADKDVFVFLAHILKRLGRTKELQSLLIRWKKMTKYQNIKLEEIKQG